MPTTNLKALVGKLNSPCRRALEGAAGLYGYVANATDIAPGSNIYYDNVTIAPTGKK